jgi:hypothetical protein
MGHMKIPFLKRMVALLAFIFVLQGCAVWVGDDEGDFHHHHGEHWEHYDHGDYGHER